MQLLQSHRAYPSPTDPDEFAFARGTRFEIERRQRGSFGTNLVLIIYTTSGKILDVEFKRTGNYEQFIGSSCEDGFVQKFVETFNVKVGLRFPAWITLDLKFEVRHDNDPIETASTSLRWFLPGDFFTVNSNVMHQVLQARNIQPASLPSP